MKQRKAHYLGRWRWIDKQGKPAYLLLQDFNENDLEFIADALGGAFERWENARPNDASLADQLEAGDRLGRWNSRSKTLHLDITAQGYKKIADERGLEAMVKELAIQSTRNWCAHMMESADGRKYLAQLDRKIRRSGQTPTPMY